MLTLTGAERIIKDLIRFMKNESVPQLPSVPLTNKRGQEAKAMYETHFKFRFFFHIKRRVKVWLQVGPCCTEALKVRS